MKNEHQIVKAVYAAKEDLQKADDLIRQYMPFIRSEASKCISGICTEQDDEYSIAMIAFHEAILGYEKSPRRFPGLCIYADPQPHYRFSEKRIAPSGGICRSMRNREKKEKLFWMI